MPIYVAHAGKRGGIRLDNLETAKNPWAVRDLTHHAIGQGIMRLFILDDTTRSYALPAETSFPDTFFQPYRVQTTHMPGHLLPERAKVTIPGQSPTNPNPDGTLHEVWMPREGEDGSHIVPIISTGRGQGYETVQPKSPREASQRLLTSRDIILRALSFTNGSFSTASNPYKEFDFFQA